MSGLDLEFVQEAFQSNYIAPLGPQVDAFERESSEKVGIPHAVAVSSGTAAVHLALRGLGVGHGDEVIASTLTFIGGVTPIVFQGATPVFIDADRSSWNMDPDLLAQELEVCGKKGKLPKAVVPTDLYGQCFDYERIFEICEAYGVPVVADAAEALGAKYNPQISQITRIRRKATEVGEKTEVGDRKSEIKTNAGMVEINVRDQRSEDRENGPQIKH